MTHSRATPIFHLLLVLYLVFLICCGASDSGGDGGPGPGTGTLQVLSGSLPSATAGASYSTTLTASGGTPPYTWSVASGTLPPGLSVTSSGQISGTPNQAGQFGFTVRVTDAGGRSADRSLAIQVSTTPPAAVTFTVNPSTTHQIWRGLRATAFGVISGNSNPFCTEISPTLRGQAWDDLVNDLGLTGLRLHFDPNPPNPVEHDQNDNNDPNVRNDSYFFPAFDARTLSLDNGCIVNMRSSIIEKQVNEIRQRVLARGEPFSLYISSDYRRLGVMPAWWQSSTSEGAEYVEAYFAWFHDRFGYWPDLFTVNEPDSTYYSGSVYIDNYMREICDRLAALGATTKLQLPEDASVNNSPARIDTLANTAGLIQNCTGVITYHSYESTYQGSTKYPDATGLQSRNAVRTRALNFGKDTGMTEICCKTNWDGRYDHGLDILRDLYMNAIEGRISYWEPLSVRGICSNNTCNVGAGSVNNFINFSNDLSTYYLQPVYWVMRQFSKYVRPGYVRLETTCSGCMQTVDRGPDIKAMTWRNSTTGKVVVILINDSGAQKSVVVSGLPAGNFILNQLDPSMCSTSGGKNRCTPQSQQVSAISNLSIPADGVWTLIQQ